MRTTLRKGAGFTMVEMLVVIFIIGIISSILIVNWRRSENQYQLQRTAYGIAQSIRKAQEMALNGSKYSGVIPNKAYGIHFYRGENYYAIFSDQNNNNTYQSPSSDILVETISLESGVVIHSLSSGVQDMDIAFILPDGFVEITPSAANPAVIIIKKTGASCPSLNCKTITIRKTGEISVD